MTEMPGPLPLVPCQCGFSDADPEDQCLCGKSERVLRAKAPLTDEQREWCRKEIDRVEGHTRADYEAADDATLASGVLDAWTDYCRDKGLM